MAGEFHWRGKFIVGVESKVFESTEIEVELFVWRRKFIATCCWCGVQIVWIGVNHDVAAN